MPCEDGYLAQMARRDEAVAPRGASAAATRCGSPTGASPVPVSVGAPGSRPQAPGETSASKRGVRSPSGGVSHAAGSEHAGRNMK